MNNLPGLCVKQSGRDANLRPIGCRSDALTTTPPRHTITISKLHDYVDADQKRAKDVERDEIRKGKPRATRLTGKVRVRRAHRLRSRTVHHNILPSFARRSPAVYQSNHNVRTLGDVQQKQQNRDRRPFIHRVIGRAENDGPDNDGPPKLRGMTLTDLTLTDHDCSRGRNVNVNVIVNPCNFVRHCQVRPKTG